MSRLLLISLFLLVSPVVKGDEVTLVSGGVTHNCVPGMSIPGTATATLTSLNFSLSVITDTHSGEDCNSFPQFVGFSSFVGPDAQVRVVYNGVITRGFGNLSFTDNLLTGTVSGVDNNLQILFTVTFTGSGQGLISPRNSNFIVGGVSEMPEPATFLLFAGGFMAQFLRRLPRLFRRKP